MKKYPNIYNQFTCLSVFAGESLTHGSHDMGAPNESYKALPKNIS